MNEINKYKAEWQKGSIYREGDTVVHHTPIYAPWAERLIWTSYRLPWLCRWMGWGRAMRAVAHRRGVRGTQRSLYRSRANYEIRSVSPEGSSDWVKVPTATEEKSSGPYN